MQVRAKRSPVPPGTSSTTPQQACFARQTGPMVGGMLAGFMDGLLFHPFDTARVRAQNSMLPRQTGFSASMFHYRQIFLNGIPQGIGLKNLITNYYAGFNWAMFYKIATKGYKFGVQPDAERAVRTYVTPVLEPTFNIKFTGPMVSGLAASIVATTEAAFTPVDIMRIKRQTGDSRSMLTIMHEDGINFFRGMNWTMARNGVGSLALFGVSAHAYDRISQTSSLPYFWQDTLANIIGGVASTIATNPFDVVKTMIQANRSHASGFSVLMQAIRANGPGVLASGLLVNCLSVAPRLALAKIIADNVMTLWQKPPEQSEKVEAACSKEVRR